MWAPTLLAALVYKCQEQLTCITDCIMEMANQRKIAMLWCNLQLASQACGTLCGRGSLIDRLELRGRFVLAELDLPLRLHAIAMSAPLLHSYKHLSPYAEPSTSPCTAQLARLMKQGSGLMLIPCIQLTDKPGAHMRVRLIGPSQTLRALYLRGRGRLARELPLGHGKAGTSEAGHSTQHHKAGHPCRAAAQPPGYCFPGGRVQAMCYRG